MTPTTEICKIDGEIIKTDCIGRIRVSCEHREKLLDTFDSSGMSGQKFAEHCGLKYTTFASWIQKRRRERNEYPVEHAAPPESLLGMNWHIGYKLTEHIGYTSFLHSFLFYARFTLSSFLVELG
jgi:hypothetical protein